MGGKRICLGKTFAEVVAKFVVPALYSKFEFSFADTQINFENPDERAKFEKPKLNLDVEVDPVVMMKIKKVNFD